MIKLEPCPRCGTLLTAALVAAIRNPDADESCPRRPKLSAPRPSTTAPMTSPPRRPLTLTELMILGSLVRSVS